MKEKQRAVIEFFTTEECTAADIYRTEHSEMCMVKRQLKRNAQKWMKKFKESETNAKNKLCNGDNSLIFLKSGLDKCVQK